MLQKTIISKYSDILLVDSMIIANLSKANSREAYKIISSIAVFLKKEEEELRKKRVSKTAYFHQSEEDEYGDNWYYYKD